MRRIIGFITDFGLSDPYVGIVKAVVSTICPQALVVDISHEVRSFDILSAAYVLYNAYRWFPKRTVFLTVVDPGVGSEREPVVVRTKGYVFVGPNNGVLYPSASADGIIEVRVITNKWLMLRDVSATFHGRDVFAPVAAWLACGGELEVVGEEIHESKLVKLELEDYFFKLDEGELCTRVVYVDKFGNVALGVRDETVVSLVKERYREFAVKGIRGSIGRTFSDVREGSLVLIRNSFGFLEIAVNKGSAEKLLGLRPGDRVCLKLS